MLLDLSKSQPLPTTECHLSPAWLFLHRQSQGLGKYMRRFPGSSQVAGVNCVYGFCGDNASQGCGLALPTWTQGQIDLSLEASLSIPDGFPMPDQE
jgi:hypothetical protein